MKPLCFGIICCATIDNLYGTQYYFILTPLDSGFQLCLANEQKVRSVCLFCSGLGFRPQLPQLLLDSPRGLQGSSSLCTPTTLFLPFSPSSLDVAWDLAIGFLHPAHTSVMSPFIFLKIVCLLFPTKTQADTKATVGEGLWRLEESEGRKPSNT